MKYSFRFSVILLLLLGILTLGACEDKDKNNTPHHSSRIFALDTVIEITAYGDKAQDAVTAAENEIYRLDNLLSVTKAQSDIYRLNNTKGEDIIVDSEVYILLDYARYINEITDGRFDITIYPILKLWGFTTDEYRIPSVPEINNALTSVNTDNIILKENYTIELADNAQIDLGGIAKGYIADKAAEAMKNTGIEYGIISLGGNVRTIGTKPSGEAFNIGIKDPYSNNCFATILTDESSAITSGAYQRNFTIDGKTYHHIIDPETGYPSESDIVSVTIIGKNGSLCDAYSTALFIGGSDYAEKLQTKDEYFDFVILTKNNNVIASENLQGKLSLADGFTHLNIIYK